MALPELREKDPDRTEINDTNVVYDDAVDLMIRISANLSRYEMSIDSRWATETAIMWRELARIANMNAKRITDIRKAENKAWNDAAEERRNEVIAERPWKARLYEKKTTGK